MKNAHLSFFLLAVNSLHVKAKRGKSFQLLRTNLTSVGCNVKMPPEMLHKQTHVAEMSLTDAALQTWNTLFRSGHVDMDINLVLLTKQDVVNRANDLEIKGLTS